GASGATGALGASIPESRVRLWLLSFGGGRETMNFGSFKAMCRECRQYAIITGNEDPESTAAAAAMTGAAARAAAAAATVAEAGPEGAPQCSRIPAEAAMDQTNAVAAETVPAA
ncbi:unnamed protein product, partial [Phaeothamnion confervicola]